jgi:Resolvase, N terminal domain
VSTLDQHPQTQIEALTAAGCEEVFTDHGVSGMKTSRPELDRCLAYLRKGPGHVVPGAADRPAEDGVMTRTAYDRVLQVLAAAGAAGVAPGELGTLAGVTDHRRPVRKLIGRGLARRDGSHGRVYATAGPICTSCGQVIGAGQPAHRLGEARWVHDVCPSPAG